MTRIASWLLGFARFWYRFIIGDDWTVAASIAAGLAVTGLLHAAPFPAWLVIPSMVVLMLRISVMRATRTRERPVRRKA
jgi:hypothetical protein